MPVQKFAPMTKDFPSFDCDAHVTEPPRLWERAKDWLTKDEFEALKGSFFFDPESKRLLVCSSGAHKDRGLRIQIGASSALRQAPSRHAGQIKTILAQWMRPGGANCESRGNWRRGERTCPYCRSLAGFQVWLKHGDWRRSTLARG
jgi:hypothetical protein